MAHKRYLAVSTADVGGLLAGLGCHLSAQPHLHADIEHTLMRASKQALQDLDFRLLALIVQWLDIHEKYINLPRLLRFVRSADSTSRGFWRAIAQWKQSNRKWHRFLALDGATSRWDLLPTGTDFHIQRKGEDRRFMGTDVRVPQGLLPIRDGDVLGVKALAQFHRIYANRIKFGVSLRADLWAHLEIDPAMSAAQLAQKVGCAFASAWEVKRDFGVLQGG